MFKHILAFFLKFINPHKPLGTVLFNAIAKVSVSVAFEAVALRRNRETEELEVYLVRRAPDDSAYPGQWHVPGSILRPAEKDEHVLVRLGKREFGTKITHSKFVAMVSYPREARGHFISLVYRVRLEGEPSENGKWFPVDKLPSNIVSHHKTYIIPLAVNHKKFSDIENVKVKTLEA